MLARATALVLALAGVGTPAHGADYGAASNYVLHCQGCHGANGVGGLPGAIPPLKEMGYFLAVPGGRQYLIQVPGVAQSPVNDEQLAELLNYTVRRFSSATLPTTFRPYTRTEVARARHGVEDIGGGRRQLVAAIYDQFGIRVWGAQGSSATSQRGEDSGTID